MNSILVVEDNADIRDVLTQMLELWLDTHHPQCTVAQTSNGAEALAWIIDHGEPDLLLLDVRMPVMNGAQLLHHLSNNMGLTLHKKTLLLTGYADDLEEHLGNDALLMPHLRKPFLADELFKALESFTAA